MLLSDDKGPLLEVEATYSEDNHNRLFEDVLRTFIQHNSLGEPDYRASSGFLAELKFDLQTEVPFTRTVYVSSAGGIGLYKKAPTGTSNSSFKAGVRSHSLRRYASLLFDHTDLSASSYSFMAWSLPEAFYLVGYTNVGTAGYYFTAVLKADRLVILYGGQTGSRANKHAVASYREDSTTVVTTVESPAISGANVIASYLFKGAGYKPIGYVTLEPLELSGKIVGVQEILMANVPSGTSVVTEYSTDGTSYGAPPDGEYEGTLYVRLRLSSTDTKKTPTVYSHKTIVQLETDDTQLMLVFAPNEGFRNAVGDILVKYSQDKGLLYGDGGSLPDFEVAFEPRDLIPKEVYAFEYSVAAESSLDITPRILTHLNRDLVSEYITVQNFSFDMVVTKSGIIDV